LAWLGLAYLLAEHPFHHQSLSIAVSNINLDLVPVLILKVITAKAAFEAGYC